MAVCRNQRVVEAGALLGFSTLLIGDVAAHVTSIDLHEGYGPSTLGPYMSNIRNMGCGNIRTVVGDFRNHLNAVKADVAFIDLTGKEDITREALSLLNKSVEIALVHDLGRVNCDGVIRAARGMDTDWDLVETIDTLGVLKRRR